MAGGKRRRVVLGCLGAFAVIVLGVLATAAAQPDTFRVERSRNIEAEPEVIRAQLVDLHRWAEWNPWADRDPDMTLQFSEPAEGAGAWYEWEGNEDVGTGRMTISSVDDQRVRYDLEFIEPFQSTSHVELRMEPGTVGTTHVTWLMEGDNDLMGKLMGLFVDWETDIARDFDQGLANLETATTDG